MGFNQNVAEEALVRCGRHCCLCHKFCGIKIELHHINQVRDGGDDSIDNCLPLCFNCHAEVRMYNPVHPKGKKYSEAELLKHRDRWFEKVANSTTKFMDESYVRLDKEVYDKIITLLDNPMKDLIKKFDFGGSYRVDEIRSLYEFVIISDYPEIEFLDLDLESEKQNLHLKVNEFLDCISINTFRDNELQDGLKRIPTDWKQDRYSDARKALNNCADELWKQYCSFRRSCRIRING